MSRTFPKSLLVLVGMAVVGGGIWTWHSGRRPPVRTSPHPSALQELAGALAAVEATEAQFDSNLWAPERLAESYGAVIEKLWDESNHTPDKIPVFARANAEQIILPQLEADSVTTAGIVQYANRGGTNLTAGEWKAWCHRVQANWRLEQIEFRHIGFDPGDTGRARRSEFAFSAHVLGSNGAVRAAIRGPLWITWRSGPQPALERIDASQLNLQTRVGQPMFELWQQETVAPPPGSFFIDPLIVYDLDQDGISEVILAASNQLWRRAPGGQFEQRPLCAIPPGLIFTAVIADFTNDGAPDYLVARFEGLKLYVGNSRTEFSSAAQPAWQAPARLKYGQVLTAGDIDADGDLDVWLGQYKVPYERGQMPTPFWDAADGHPGYLLLNDGSGRFTEAVLPPSLEEKRRRRTYAASLVDLDQDQQLDLVLVSDFAGIDLFRNAGRGVLVEQTSKWLDERAGFGMGHVVADFNRDGHLDMLMIGMNSPTADRLQRLALARTGSEIPARGAVTYGNRLYEAQADGRFKQTEMNASIARSGWSWGGAALDADNDGYADLYIANGHDSREFVRDYEPEFWLHDIYVGNSRENPIAQTYFGAKFARTRSNGMSYGGYEKNRLYLNQAGRKFIEAGHLMGVALEEDSRNVVAADLDADGRPDLVVTTFEVWPTVRQTVRIFKNVAKSEAHWIGFRLRELGNGLSPVGSTVTVRGGTAIWTHQIITGDSYRSQHGNTVHFGLGTLSRVETAEIRWANGKTLALQNPAVDRYHEIKGDHVEK